MRKLLISLVILLSATPLSAQWRRAGLFGADVRALIAHPKEPDTLFLGTSSGEIYVSRNAGQSWSQPRNGAPFPNFVVDNLLVDRDGNLWAASWGLWGGGVIAMSPDGGKTWTRRDAGLEDFSVRAIAVDPGDATSVVVGGLTGVYRSKDRGRTWKKISDQVNVESLAIDPRSSERIYVGTWRQGWRTDDGGATWKHIADGMVLDTDMFSITIDSKNPDNVWVATCGWVYNSKNSGDKWTRYKEGFNNRRIHAVEMDPCDAGTVFAGSVAGLYRSDDHGKTWYVTSDEGMVVNSIVLHPQRPGRVILGIEGDGVYVSNDHGKTYERTSEGLHNLRITSVASDPLKRDRVYAAVAFGGAASGIYRSDDAGMTWKKLSHTMLPEVLSLNVASFNETEPKLIAGTEKGFYWSNDGTEWTQAEPVAFPIRVSKVVRFNPQRSFAATSEGVFTTRDGGRSWYRLAGATNRAVDAALMMHNGKKALLALTDAGLELFDGSEWKTVSGAPQGGRTIATRDAGKSDVVFVAGTKGVKAGHVDASFRWSEIDAPDAQFASVHAATRSDRQMLFLTSRQQREILVGNAAQEEWSELTLPVNDTQVTSVVPDPFHKDRYYVGTLGDGVFVYEGLMRKYAAKPGLKTALSGGR